MPEECKAESSEVKFCVTAMIDLQGFSSHLEVSSYDLRTTIGKKAITRLQILEDALSLYEKEKIEFPQYYPEFHIENIRINDAIYFCMDLDDISKPGIGEIKRSGFSGNELNQLFTVEDLKTEESLIEALNNRESLNNINLMKFIGAISRVYSYINYQESMLFHPGAKGVISTGLRLPFTNSNSNKEDILSANFSFTNAYIAGEKYLKGVGLFIDDSLLQILCKNDFAKNLVLYSFYLNKGITFNPFENNEKLSKYELTNSIEFSLFHKQFSFHELHCNVLTYMQILPELLPYLQNKKTPNLEDPFIKGIFNAIKKRPSKDNFQPSGGASLLFHMLEDIGCPIYYIPECIASGKSSTYEEKNRQEWLESATRVKQNTQDH